MLFIDLCVQSRMYEALLCTYLAAANIILRYNYYYKTNRCCGPSGGESVKVVYAFLVTEAFCS